MAPSPSSASEVLRQVLKLDKSSNEFPDSLNSMLRAKEYPEFISALKQEEIMAFINFLDQAIEHIPAGSDLSHRCLRALRKICSNARKLPSSHIISDGLYSTSTRVEASGGFADVLIGSYNNLQVAIKALRVYELDDAKAIERRLCKEVVIWKRLVHPNVLPLLGVATLSSRLCMISEWMPHGSIVQYLETHPGVNRPELLLDIASGLNYLHTSQVVHGDLKGLNILIDSNCHARLADFGLAAITSDSVSYNASSASGGSVRWMAPELLNPPQNAVAQPTQESDIYAFAMVVIEVFTCNVPFHMFRNELVMFKVIEGQRPGRPEESHGMGFSDEVWNIVETCWKGRPDERPKISEVLRCFESAVSVDVLPLDLRSPQSPTTQSTVSSNPESITALPIQQTPDYQKHLSPVTLPTVTATTFVSSSLEPGLSTPSESATLHTDTQQSWHAQVSPQDVSSRATTPILPALKHPQQDATHSDRQSPVSYSMPHLEPQTSTSAAPIPPSQLELSNQPLQQTSTDLVYGSDPKSTQDSVSAQQEKSTLISGKELDFLPQGNRNNAKHQSPILEAKTLDPGCCSSCIIQ